MVDGSLRLKEWGDLGRGLPSKEKSRVPVSWESCRRLINSAEALVGPKVSKLQDLIRKSEARLSLQEPLTLRFDRHRWLASDREEAYSDWLALVLTELGAQFIKPLLYGNEIPPTLSDAQGDFTVDREFWVPNGHEGHGGRLDLAITFDSGQVLVIEVKVVGAEAADTEKQKGYVHWLKRQEKPVKPILIAIDGSSEYHGFRTLKWEDFCKRARFLLPKVIHRRGVVVASLLAAFVGAVEVNLLRFPALHWISTGQEPRTVLAALRLGSGLDEVIDYLGKCVNEEVRRDV